MQEVLKAPFLNISLYAFLCNIFLGLKIRRIVFSLCLQRCVLEHTILLWLKALISHCRKHAINIYMHYVDFESINCTLINTTQIHKRLSYKNNPLLQDTVFLLCFFSSQVLQFYQLYASGHEMCEKRDTSAHRWRSCNFCLFLIGIHKNICYCTTSRYF